jgi:hypothetical protein
MDHRRTRARQTAAPMPGHFRLAFAGWQPAEVGSFQHFAGVKALRGVSVTIERGQIYHLIGENGCGKSTLILSRPGGRNRVEEPVMPDFALAASSSWPERFSPCARGGKRARDARLPHRPIASTGNPCWW